MSLFTWTDPTEMLLPSPPTHSVAQRKVNLNPASAPYRSLYEDFPSLYIQMAEGDPPPTPNMDNNVTPATPGTPAANGAPGTPAPKSSKLSPLPAPMTPLVRSVCWSDLLSPSV